MDSTATDDVVIGSGSIRIVSTSRSCPRRARVRGGQDNGRLLPPRARPARTPTRSQRPRGPTPAPAAAERAGYRPCLRCRPETAPACPAWKDTKTTPPSARWLARGRRPAPREALETALSGRLGAGPRHLSRRSAEHLSASPAAQVALSLRIQRAERLHDGFSGSPAAALSEPGVHGPTSHERPLGRLHEAAHPSLYRQDDRRLRTNYVSNRNPCRAARSTSSCLQRARSLGRTYPDRRRLLRGQAWKKGKAGSLIKVSASLCLHTPEQGGLNNDQVPGAAGSTL